MYKLWSCCKEWSKCGKERVIYEHMDLVEICYMMDKHTMGLDREGHYKIEYGGEIIASGDSDEVKDEVSTNSDIW